MHPVPHAVFEAILETAAEEPHPPGASLAKRLEDGLREQFADVGERDNWRDCGWSVTVQCEALRIQVYFAPYAQEGNWLLAIAPETAPGVLARLFGRKAPIAAPELQRVSSVVHEILTQLPQVQGIHWMLGGPPEKVPHAPSPGKLAWDAGL